MSNGVVPAAIEDLDAQAVAITAVRFPVALPGRGFCMIVETGGYEREPRYGREELLDTVRTSLAIRLGLAAGGRYRGGECAAEQTRRLKRLARA